MDINKWMNKELSNIANKLEKSIKKSYHVETGDSLSLSGRMEIYEILDLLLSAIFPGSYSREKIHFEEINYYLNDILRHICYKLKRYLIEVFQYRCGKENCDKCSCEERSENVIITLMNSLPGIREILLLDITAAFNGDPAAKSLDEIVLSYPSIEAIATHRIAHVLYKASVPVIPRIMSERAHSNTGIDIHPGANIGESFFIDHGTGVVIGETCTIGKNVKIYQGVTLGAVSPFDKEGKPRKGEKRHPDIEDDVIIYANATILGGKTTIGKGSIIGGNTWITESVEPGTVVYNKK